MRTWYNAAATQISNMALDKESPRTVVVDGGFDGVEALVHGFLCRRHVLPHVAERDVGHGDPGGLGEAG